MTLIKWLCSTVFGSMTHHSELIRRCLSLLGTLQWRHMSGIVSGITWNFSMNYKSTYTKNNINALEHIDVEMVAILSHSYYRSTKRRHSSISSANCYTTITLKSWLINVIFYHQVRSYEDLHNDNPPYITSIMCYWSHRQYVHGLTSGLIEPVCILYCIICSSISS